MAYDDTLGDLYSAVDLTMISCPLSHMSDDHIAAIAQVFFSTVDLRNTTSNKYADEAYLVELLDDEMYEEQMDNLVQFLAISASLHPRMHAAVSSLICFLDNPIEKGTLSISSSGVLSQLRKLKSLREDS